MKARAARRRIHEIHVYKGDGSLWVVSCGPRTLSRHRTQRTAAIRGARVARRRCVDVVIHGRNGRFRSKDSYGRESHQRDTER